jgi:hypothetical protein
MSLLRCIAVLEFATAIALGQSAPSSKPPDLTGQPVAVVRNLYNEVVARHAAGIPDGTDMQAFAPYLSKALLHRIDLAKACSVEWDQQNPEPDLGAQFVSSYGLFSGEGAEAEPRSFQIEKTEPGKDGSLIVFVGLTWQKPPERPWTWRVAAVVLREKDRYVIDDVIYVNDSIYDKPEEKPADKLLSEYLSAGCNGPHWIGYSLPNQPETLARSFYQQVVARQPLGVPSGADWRALTPYLSKALLHKISVNLACQEDWDRQNPSPDLKPPFLEDGLFTGGNERAEPRAFHIERAESAKDGSFRRLST